MTKKIVIIGAGPCGLFLAHTLRRRGRKYQIEIYDRRPDPRLISFENSRTFPISLNTRGMTSLGIIPHLKSVVRDKTSLIKGSMLHLSNGKIRRAIRNSELLTMDRTKLVITLLNELTKSSDLTPVKINFNSECHEINFTKKTVTFCKEPDFFSVNYDIIIGVDGSRSRVRRVLQKNEKLICEEKYISSDYKTLFLPSDSTLESNYIHAWNLPDTTSVLMVVSPPPELSSGLITVPRENNRLVKLTKAEQLREFLQEKFPDLNALIPDSEIEAFLQRPIASVLTVRCDKYHYKDSVLILGDAAHAVSPSLGLGCNSALEDVQILDSLLDEYHDNWETVISEFTHRRKADAHALLEICENPIPYQKSLFLELKLRQFWAKIIGRPFLYEMLFDTTVPYTEILGLYKGWLEKVKKSNQEWLKHQKQKD
jgi:kynurenine 3-monooxygenase